VGAGSTDIIFDDQGRNIFRHWIPQKRHKMEPQLL